MPTHLDEDRSVPELQDKLWFSNLTSRALNPTAPNNTLARSGPTAGLRRFLVPSLGFRRVSRESEGGTSTGLISGLQVYECCEANQLIHPYFNRQPSSTPTKISQKAVYNTQFCTHIYFVKKLNVMKTLRGHKKVTVSFQEFKFVDTIFAKTWQRSMDDNNLRSSDRMKKVPQRHLIVFSRTFRLQHFLICQRNVRTGIIDPNIVNLIVDFTSVYYKTCGGYRRYSSL